MNNHNITHIIATDLKRNVNDVVADLMLRDVYIVDILRPVNAIFADVPKNLNIKFLKNIKGIKRIKSNLIETI